MNRGIQDRTLSTAAAVVVVTAALAASSENHADLIAGHADWPVHEPSLYFSHISEPTVSFIEQSSVVEDMSAAEDFGREIGAVYASLLEGLMPELPYFF